MGSERDQLVVSAEKVFGIAISAEEESRIRCMRDFIHLIARKLEGNGSRLENAKRIRRFILDALGMKDAEYPEAAFIRDLQLA